MDFTIPVPSAFNTFSIFIEVRPPQLFYQSDNVAPDPIQRPNSQPAYLDALSGFASATAFAALIFAHLAL